MKIEPRDKVLPVSWSLCERPRIAYFCMEVGLFSDLPTYSGGLGVLAGDTIRAAADLAIPFAAMTLVHRRGFFRQRIDSAGRQVELPAMWTPQSRLEPVDRVITVPVEGRRVEVGAWRLMVRGATGAAVPVYFLDTDREANSDWDRTLTDSLYGGDHHYRLCQETILGIGGLRMLRAIYGRDESDPFTAFHMNEGHACLLTIELLSEHIVREKKRAIDDAGLSFVRNRCVFTTHTPIEAGHDRFAIDHVRHVVGDHPAFRDPALFGDGKSPDIFNTTCLALSLSRAANGVARKHAEVSRAMFPGARIDAITNGIHAGFWAAPPMQEVFDRVCPTWRIDHADLRLVAGADASVIRQAHRRSKAALLRRINEECPALIPGFRSFDADALTIGFARRATSYKRPDLIISDLDRLLAIAEATGPIQIVFAGKAHPSDHIGKACIARIHDAAGAIASRGPSCPVRIALLQNYSIELGQLLTAGVDVWLNNPIPPLEASGTSGMKAALNGVPSLSVLDGWWLEGCIEGVTGWAIGGPDDAADVDAIASHQTLLYDKLQGAVAPMYYKHPADWAAIMRSCISINGPQFSTQRMVRDYCLKAYA